MKKGTLLVVSLLLGATAMAVGTILSSDGTYELDHSGPKAIKYGLGTAIKSAQMFGAKGNYDVLKHGGSVASYNLKGLDSEDLTLPSKAIITDCFFDVVTPMASAGGSGRIAISANSSGDLKAATDADTFSGQVACIPSGAENVMVKLTAERTLSVTVDSEALTAGNINVFVQYALSN